MKLRIKGDSMRLRVSRSELARLLNGERVEDTVHFSAQPDSHFTYGLQLTPQPVAIRIKSEPQSVMVLLSEEQMTSWSVDTEVGIYGTVDLGHTGSLDVMIEKDFACLDRSDEDNFDTFTNPNAGTVCKICMRSRTGCCGLPKTHWRYPVRVASSVCACANDHARPGQPIAYRSVSMHIDHERNEVL